ncbi:transcription initiation factor TFIID subunit 1-like, partial [Anneissia japonica]|uniref:transcription initiation factor TFIID subunit 1-like n=1 Tax=Anneissia japonica TaxID=1529436 RepID=UPI001425B94A
MAQGIQPYMGTYIAPKRDDDDENYDEEDEEENSKDASLMPPPPSGPSPTNDANVISPTNSREDRTPSRNFENLTSRMDLESSIILPSVVPATSSRSSPSDSEGISKSPLEKPLDKGDGETEAGDSKTKRTENSEDQLLKDSSKGSTKNVDSQTTPKKRKMPSVTEYFPEFKPGK